MGWKFGGIYLNRDYSGREEILFAQLQLSLHPTHEKISLQEVTSSLFYDTAIQYYQGRTLIHNNFLPYDCAFEAGKFYEFDEILSLASHQADILCFFLDDITSTYGMSLFTGGRRARSRGVISGKLLLDEGRPLVGEKKMPLSYEEQRIFAVVSHFLGGSFLRLLENRSFSLEIYQSD